MANGKPVKIPATIDDPAVIDEVQELLKARGFPK
jgi:butyrate kinase